MTRFGEGASRPHTCGTVSRLVHRGGAYGGAATNGMGAAQESLSPPAGSAGHGEVEAISTCRTGQRTIDGLDGHLMDTKKSRAGCVSFAYRRCAFYASEGRSLTH